jgi:hypothetical protein
MILKSVLVWTLDRIFDFFFVIMVDLKKISLRLGAAVIVVLIIVVSTIITLRSIADPPNDNHNQTDTTATTVAPIPGL